MTRYEVTTPSTLLLRVLAPRRAEAALRMLDGFTPGVRSPEEISPQVRIFTLADVSSGPEVTPPAACLATGDGRTAWIGRFAVAVPLRRRGLGRRLLDEVTTMMRAEGVRLLALRVASSRKPMTTLLAASGFALTAEHELGACHPADLEIADDEAPWVWAVREL